MNFFQAFFAEKALDDRTYEVISAAGTLNLISTETVIAAINRTQGAEAQQIEGILRKLDFMNGDIHHFLAHIARGLAVDF